MVKQNSPTPPRSARKAQAPGASATPNTTPPSATRPTTATTRTTVRPAPNPQRKTGSGRAVPKSTPWKTIAGIAAVLVIAIGAIYLLSSGFGTSAPTTPSATGAGVATGTTDIAGVVTYANLDRTHVDGTVSYAQVPPVGGSHNAFWLNCGVYDQPVPNEQAVHSLEHGAIWITYQPTLADSEVQALRALVRQSGYRLLSPYPGIDSPIIASAWGAQLKLDKGDDPRLTQFIQRYEQDPKGPEPGAACSGGRGQPISN